MSTLVGTLDVPVVWSPSDLVGPDSDGHVGRTQPIRAIVHHRVVGTLESMTNVTFKPSTDPLLTPGERRVSSHFGIGFWGTALRIVQYVALENTAYCNGQSAADKAACTWRLWIAAGRPSANEMTVSIEHEDNAAAGKYIVLPEIIAASIALDRLLLSGDGPAIRAAGIHCSDAAAAQLRAIVPSTETLVDHKVVAPVSKPYCWRAYGSDAGFPQARYVRELQPQETDMGEHVTPFATPLPFTVPNGTRSFGATAPYGELSAVSGPVSVDGTVVIVQTAVPHGSFLRIVTGATGRRLVPAAGATPTAAAPVDCSAVVAAEHERTRTAAIAAVQAIK